MRIFKLKPVVNKKNGQINFSLPKKKMSKKLSDALKANPNLKLKFKLEGFS